MAPPRIAEAARRAAPTGIHQHLETNMSQSLPGFGDHKDTAILRKTHQIVLCVSDLTRFVDDRNQAF